MVPDFANKDELRLKILLKVLISITYGHFQANFKHSHNMDICNLKSLRSLWSKLPTLSFCATTYHLTKISNFSARTHSTSYIAISGQIWNLYDHCSQSYQNCPFVLPANQDFNLFSPTINTFDKVYLVKIWSLYDHCSQSYQNCPFML